VLNEELLRYLPIAIEVIETIAEKEKKELERRERVSAATGHFSWRRDAMLTRVVGTVAPRLTEGAEVYCDERRLSLGTWTGRDGTGKSLD
jgi:hypothetical protein